MTPLYKRYETAAPVGAVAYYSGFSGLETHGIEYGVNDYLYCVSGAWVQSAYKRMYQNGGCII